MDLESGISEDICDLLFTNQKLGTEMWFKKSVKSSKKQNEGSTTGL